MLCTTHRLNAGQASRSGMDEEDSVGYERQDHAAVFDLSMDYSDDEVLLDWEQYSGKAMECCVKYSMA